MADVRAPLQPGERRDTAPLPPTCSSSGSRSALVLQSLASGRQPDELVLVTLPLVLLGGIGLGRVFERVNWRPLVTTRDGLILAALLGLAFGLIGVITLTARTNDPVLDPGNDNQPGCESSSSSSSSSCQWLSSSFARRSMPPNPA